MTEVTPASDELVAEFKWLAETGRCWRITQEMGLALLARLTAAEAERDKAKKDAGLCADEWAKEIASSNMLRGQLKHASAERDTYKRVCEHAGVCMTCVLGAPESYGCSDCLNTGWQGGSPYEQIKVVEAERDAAIARAERLAEALRAFVQHYQSWMDRHADNIRSTVFPTHTFGDLRRARAALAEKEAADDV